MPLILLEGPRNSGKTYLSSIISYPKFKFDFTGVYGGLNLASDGKTTHSLGLGKEIMLHQLYSKGFLGPNLIVDRGILTNQVWGRYQDRVGYDEIFNEIDFINSSGLFINVEIILIKSDSPVEFRKNKDHWDHLENESERIEESSIFHNVSSYMIDNGIKIHEFINHFDSDSEVRFKELIDKIICAEF
jgi:hypothetical protein